MFKNKKPYVIFAPARQTYGFDHITSEFAVAYCSGERKDIADIAHSGEIHHASFKAKAES